MSEGLSALEYMLGAISVGCGYAALLLSYFVVHSTVLAAPTKGAGRLADLIVLVSRLVLFGAVGVSLMLVRPLALYFTEYDPFPSVLAAATIPVVFAFGLKVIVPWVRNIPRSAQSSSS